MNIRPIIQGLTVLVGLGAWGDFLLRNLLPAFRQAHWPNPGYWVAARLIWEGKAPLLYADTATFSAEAVRLGTVPDIFNANAPSTVLIFLPFGLLPETTAHNLWLVLIVICFLAAWLILLAALRLSFTVGLAFTALVPLYHPLRENISRGQVYPVVFLALAAGAAWAVGRMPLASRQTAGDPSRRSLALAGIAFGVICIVKLYYGVVLLVPALVRRQWMLLATAVGVFGASVVLTALFWGPDLWISALTTAATWRARPETAVTAYQTINSLLGHLLRYDPQWNLLGPVARLPQLIDPLWYAAALLLGGASVIALWRAARTPAEGTRRFLPVALTVPLALLFSPIAEDYHYILALFPLLVTGLVLAQDYLRVRAAPERSLTWREGVYWAAYGVIVVLLGAPWGFNVPSVGGWHALAYYPRVWGALLLWGLTWMLLWRGPERSPEQRPEQRSVLQTVEGRAR